MSVPMRSQHGQDEVVDDGSQKWAVDNGPQKTRAARKRRQQRLRADARHVSWLTSLCQVAGSHHSGAMVATLKSVVDSLRREVASLRDALAKRERVPMGSAHKEDVAEKLVGVQAPGVVVSPPEKVLDKEAGGDKKEAPLEMDTFEEAVLIESAQEVLADLSSVLQAAAAWPPRRQVSSGGKQEAWRVAC